MLQSSAGVIELSLQIHLVLHMFPVLQESD